MLIITRLKKKISQLKNSFDVQKVPIMLQKDLETMTYLKKITIMYGIKNLSFLDLNSFTKITLITFMIFGKVEIIAILFLFKKFIFRE